jgi:hypothetical protein
MMMACVSLQEPSSTMLLQRDCLATSLAGNAVDVLTITAPEGCGKPLSQRQGVVLSGADIGCSLLSLLMVAWPACCLHSSMTVHTVIHCTAYVDKRSHDMQGSLMLLME